MCTKTTFQKLLLASCLSLSLNSCFKGDPPTPFVQPSEVRIDATVPEVVYINQKLVTLDARRTNLINGHRTLRYKWSCLIYPSNLPPNFSDPDNELTLIDSLRVGTYQLQLAVTDTAGNSNVSKFNMVVKPDSLSGPPRMNVLRDTIFYLPKASIALNGSIVYSVNPPGRDLQFKWSLIQQPAGSPPLEILSPTNPVTSIKGYDTGRYIFRLEAKNDLGLSAADTMEVYFKRETPANQVKIYENLGWIYVNDDWGNSYYYLRINDPGNFIDRTSTDMQVQVWDYDLQIWSAPDKYEWYLNGEDLVVFYYGASEPGLGTAVRVKVTFF